MDFRMTLNWLGIAAVSVLSMMSVPPEVAEEAAMQIRLGENATPMEIYAARELQRYLYNLSGTLVPIAEDKAPLAGPAFLIGRPENNTLLAILESQGSLPGLDSLESQGYWLRGSALGGMPVLAITGREPAGVLYGVYGLLEDHFGVTFHLWGDVIPEPRTPLAMPQLDERVSPRQYIRGFLPWTNFFQSATVYSLDDYRFIIDQMARMRMNFIHIHNYNGMFGHNEMFHNFSYNGQTSRVWMATASSGHAWGGVPWDVSRYLFGARDLFGDYDFGSDATLHNESLDNEEVFAKGVAMFQQVLRHAHERGVKIGLGVELDLIPDEYGTQSDNPAVVDARIDQLIGDYPGLDYLMCFRSETISSEGGSRFDNVFERFYERYKAEAPQTRLAVSGWGFPPEEVEKLPADVIIAPIAPYGAQWQRGDLFGGREYWACPWLEKDFESSVYYYPYNINLSDTVKSYRDRADNTKGFLCLTWRLADAVDAKMWYIARAPWDLADHYKSATDVYRDYAVRHYGENVADQITAIIDENEAFASGFSECMGTPEFSGQARTTDTLKARQQIETVEAAMDQATSEARRVRLDELRQRLIGVEAFCKLDEGAASMSTQQLTETFGDWARSFVARVNDISSLGNVVSSQNRFVQLRYVGALIERGQWDVAETVENIQWSGEGGNAFRIFVISPPTSITAGQPVAVTARLLSAQPYEDLWAKLEFRTPGADKWQSVDMTRRGRAVFAGEFPTGAIKPEGLEYIIRAGDGQAESVFPVGGPNPGLTLTVEIPADSAVPAAPVMLAAEGPALHWQSPDEGTTFYRIYRDRDADFTPGPANLLTWVAPETMRFEDSAGDFNGQPLEGIYHYRVSAVNADGNESAPSEAVAIEHIQSSLRNPELRLKAANCQLSSQARAVPCSEGWEAIRFNHMTWIDLGTFDFTAAPDNMEDTSLFTLRVSNGGESFTLELREGNPVAGPLLASIIVENTGGDKAWKTMIQKLDRTLSGPRRLYLRAVGTPWVELGSLHWISFEQPKSRLNADGATLKGASVSHQPWASIGKVIGFFGENAGDQIQWIAPAGTGLQIRFSNATGGQKQCSVYSGGQDIATATFPDTGAWHLFQELMIEGVSVKNQDFLTLQVDEDDLAANGGAGNFCANIDWIEVVKKAEEK